VIDQVAPAALLNGGNKFPLPRRSIRFFEPHTDLIKRGKVQTPIEFGHRSFLRRKAARGLITQYEVLDGNSRRRQHRGSFAGTPQSRTFRRCSPNCTDRNRGFFRREERDVVQAARRQSRVHSTAGRQAKRPSAKPIEKSREFSRTASAFAAGIEGRISVFVPRSRHEALSRQGRERFELWVAAAVLANNLI